MNFSPEWVGYAAALLTTLAYIPQTIKVLRTKHTQSISLGMYSMISGGILLWLVYGWMIDSWPMIIANGTTLIMSLYIMMMKIRHG